MRHFLVVLSVHFRITLTSGMLEKTIKYFEKLFTLFKYQIEEIFGLQMRLSNVFRSFFITRKCSNRQKNHNNCEIYFFY